jgi:hypothetical protein
MSYFICLVASADLATDANISRRANIAELDGRDLESVGSAWLAPETSTKIDRMSTHVQGSWNQFEANKRLYNVQDTFDENLYTKRLDKSMLTREQQEKADRIANQIEKSSTSNIHLKEERGQLGDSLEIDEEDMYSGVIRTDQPAAGSAKGSNRGAPGSTASPAGTWRKMEVSGMVSPSGSGKQKMTSPSGKNKPAAAETTASTSAPAPAAAEEQVKFQSPALPPGFSQQPPGFNQDEATASKPTSPADTAPAEEKAAPIAVDASAVDKKEVDTTTAAAAAPATPKSSFTFNLGAAEFVPSFVKSPPTATTPSTPPANPVASPHDGGAGGGGRGHGRGGGRGRGRGGRHGGQHYVDRNFQGGNGHMGFGPGQGMMSGMQMGYDMNMYPGAMPYGMVPGGMPMPFDGGYGGGGFYPPPPPGGYFVPQYDPSFGGMQGGGMMPGPPMGMGFDQQHGGMMPNFYPPTGPPGAVPGLPVAAGLGNIAQQQTGHSGEGEEGGEGK